MQISSSSRLLHLISSVVYFAATATSQSYSSCNPLTQGGCPADPALGKSTNIDFTSQSNDFTTSGTPAPVYGSNGAAFTIQGSGDSPTITSKWYIMFGRVDFVIQAAPGQGIVSSAILQSDCLDEIDWEWLGGDDTQVQSNYFGKGITTTGYNRGAFHGAPNNHDSFSTYTIEWTADQIVWQINGQTVRVLTQADAAQGQYPQTPMQIKVGIWAGGDPANPPGTIEWAGGQVDYTKGPYTMYLKGIAATDYSTGTSYSYDGTAGTWQSIVSNGGTINPSGNGNSQVSVSASPPVSTAIPFPSSSSLPVSLPGSPSSFGPENVPPSQVLSGSGIITETTYNEQGFPTTILVDPNLSIGYDGRGFPTTITVTSDANGAISTATGQTSGSASGIVVAAPSNSNSDGTPLGAMGNVAARTVLEPVVTVIIALLAALVL